MKKLFKGLTLFAVVFAVMLVMTGCGKNETKDEGKTTDSGNVVPQSQTTVYKVNYNNFTFSIPEDLMYEQKTSGLEIGDKAGTWAVQLATLAGNFEQLKNNKGQLQPYFQSKGYTSKAAEVKTVQGKEFITVELQTQGYNMLGIYGKLNPTTLFWAVGMNSNNEIDYTILDKIAPIIDSAVYSEPAKGMATSKFNFNTKDFEKFAK